jgi:hypothetical protein
MIMKCSRCGIDGIHACLGEPNKCLVCGGSCHNTACIKTAITCDEFNKQYMGEFKPEPSPTLILAASYYDYISFIRYNKLNKSQFVYADNAEKLHGYWRPNYIETQSARMNDNYFKLKEMLRSRGAVKVGL